MKIIITERQYKLLLNEQETSPTEKSDKIEFDKQTIFSQKKLTPFVSEKTGILYIPKNIGGTINPKSEEITAYGITQNTYKVGSETYTFPTLTVLTPINIWVTPDKHKKENGFNNIKLNNVVTYKNLNKGSKLEVIESVKKDASSWYILSIFPKQINLNDFININKNRLQLDLPKLTMENEITKSVYRNPTKEILSSVSFINLMGGKIV